MMVCLAAPPSSRSRAAQPGIPGNPRSFAAPHATQPCRHAALQLCSLEASQLHNPLPCKPAALQPRTTREARQITRRRTNHFSHIPFVIQRSPSPIMCIRFLYNAEQLRVWACVSHTRPPDLSQLVYCCPPRGQTLFVDSALVFLRSHLFLFDHLQLCCLCGQTCVCIVCCFVCCFPRGNH